METLSPSVLEPPAAVAAAPVTPSFRQSDTLSEPELLLLRRRHEELARALTPRLSLFARGDVTVELARLETVSFRKLIGGMMTPTHLTGSACWKRRSRSAAGWWTGCSADRAALRRRTAA